MDPFMKENRVSLLTIPRTDLDSSAPANNDSAACLLLQLPPGWKPSDLKGARFVGASADQHQHQQQAALVVESKQCSFSCFTVETSNAFIMVPPPAVDDDASNNNNNNNNNKRSKVRDDGKLLAAVPARLLTAGGSGASFLELRPKELRRSDLRAALLLRDNGAGVWDPYDAAAAAADADDTNNKHTTQQKGQTLDELAARLQVSTAQIRKGLARLPNALRRQRRSASGTAAADQQYYYVLVSEEPLQECYAAIVAALTEVDDFSDYAAADGIAVRGMVEKALYRMSHETSFVDADHVILHCLRQLAASRNNSSSSTDDDYDYDNDTNQHDARIRLDVGKVAVCVAHRLFQKEPSSAMDVTAFFDAWQSELPGVGPRYQVHPDMLLGVAVVVVVENEPDGTNDNDNDNNGRRQWHYLPADKLSSMDDPQVCFDELFRVKDRWLLRELEPYLERLSDDATAAELLVRFTQMEKTEERDGISTKVYLKK